MKVFTPEELVEYARKESSFYKDLYTQLSDNFCWNDVPIIEQSDFWEANSWKENQLLTSKAQKGVLFKSGGTTGRPKFSYFSDDEWFVFCKAFGEGMGEANLRDGDRVGNLFYAGELYASFLFIQKSLDLCGKEVISFPFAGKTPFEELAKSILEFDINVLCGVPTSFIQFAKYCFDEKIELSIDRLLYGGEALYPDQEVILKQAFPNVEIYSVGYASVDGGILGKRSIDCRESEHRVFGDLTLMEIVDDNGVVIDAPDIEGRLLLTNLTRSLMPIIRYPVGDQAKWVEVGEKLLICGRSQEGARVGPITINRDDLVSILETANILSKVSQFQMITSHYDGLDALKILIVPQAEKESGLKVSELEYFFYNQRKMFKEAVSEKLVHPILFVICKEDELFKNERTGKCPVILDRRSI